MVSRFGCVPEVVNLYADSTSPSIVTANVPGSPPLGRASDKINHLKVNNTTLSRRQSLGSSSFNSGFFCCLAVQSIRIRRTAKFWLLETVLQSELLFGRTVLRCTLRSSILAYGCRSFCEIPTPLGIKQDVDHLLRWHWARSFKKTSHHFQALRHLEFPKNRGLKFQIPIMKPPAQKVTRQGPAHECIALRASRTRAVKSRLEKFRRTHINTYMCLYICMHACILTHAHTPTPTPTHTRAQTQTHKHVYIRIHV